jgi:hypothetical protein
MTIRASVDRSRPSARLRVQSSYPVCVPAPRIVVDLLSDDQTSPLRADTPGELGGRLLRANHLLQDIVGIRARRGFRL